MTRSTRFGELRMRAPADRAATVHSDRVVDSLPHAPASIHVLDSRCRTIPSCLCCCVMLMFRGGALGALLVVLAGVFAAAPPAQAQPPADGVAIKVGVKLTKQGDLQVAETVTVPRGGHFDMELPLRVALGDKGSERRFKVSNI